MKGGARGEGEPWLLCPEHLLARPILPGLVRVTGWSKAKAKPHPPSPAGRETAKATHPTMRDLSPRRVGNTALWRWLAGGDWEGMAEV